MKRIWNKETLNFVGKRVKVGGWIDAIRDHGKIIFFDLRDKTGILQVICEKEKFGKLSPESVVFVEGIVQKRPPKTKNPDIETGEIELIAEKISLLALAKPLPFDLKNLNLSLPKLLDYRPITLRNPKIQAIFKIQEKVIEGFREALKDLGFFEFQAPSIVASATEGGAELFEVNYYGKKAYLAQSPQLYKQMLVSSFERVFTVTKAFRAEPSLTTRHLSEYISLDCEMGFIESWEELLEVCEIVMKSIFAKIEKEAQKELKIFGATVPKIKTKIPRLKLKEAQKIIQSKTKRNLENEMDLDPEGEKEICKYVKEKYNSELVFITHFPAAKRPFYTFPDPEDENLTLSFDLLFRGLEIVTGGQRIHSYQMLKEKMKKFGLNPKNFEFYLQAFKYGMPPEGGFALGAERITKQILGLENVKEASLFPRDMTRIDKRLTK